VRHAIKRLEHLTHEIAQAMIEERKKYINDEDLRAPNREDFNKLFDGDKKDVIMTAKQAEDYINSVMNSYKEDVCEN